MPIDIIKLRTELRTFGFPVEVAVLDINADTSAWTELSTFHDRTGDGKQVRVDWPFEPTFDQVREANLVIMTHDGSETIGDKMDKITVERRAIAACAFAIRALYMAMPPSSRPSLPRWVMSTMEKIFDAIKREGGDS